MEIVTETITKYKSTDGIIFDSQSLCVKHEEKLKLQKIYMLRGSSGCVIGYFSSIKNIEQYCLSKKYEEYQISTNDIWIDELMINLRKT